MSHAPASVEPITTAQLRDLLDAELRGPETVEITWLNTISDAQANELTFARDTTHVRTLADSKAGAAIVSRAVAHEAPESMCVLVVDDADRALITVLERFAAMEPADHAAGDGHGGVHPSAIVDDSSTLGPGVAIGPGCIVGPGVRLGEATVLVAGVVLGRDVSIGRGCVLRPGVVIEARCHVGEGCTIHAGTVIGADGFGYRPAPSGQGLVKIPHIGGVRIGNDVEIGANCSIDRGKFGDTVIGDGTKLDNLVQVGHNTQIGRCCVLCGQVGLGGSVTLGDGVVMGGQAGARDNISLGSRARLGGKSGAARSIPAGEGWAGVPAVPARQHLRQSSILGRAELMFDELFSRLEALEAERLR